MTQSDAEEQNSSAVASNAVISRLGGWNFSPCCPLSTILFACTHEKLMVALAARAVLGLSLSYSSQVMVCAVALTGIFT
jgi:hypothetical protein